MLCATNSISWDEAAGQLDEVTTVSGPVVEASYITSVDGKPTFINLGKQHPDPDRFTVVIWDNNRSSFPNNPEEYYLGKEICVRGLISSYQGSLQIEVNDPSQIEVK